MSSTSNKRDPMTDDDIEAWWASVQNTPTETVEMLCNRQASKDPVIRALDQEISRAVRRYVQSGGGPVEPLREEIAKSVRLAGWRSHNRERFAQMQAGRKKRRE